MSSNLQPDLAAASAGLSKRGYAVEVVLPGDVEAMDPATLRDVRLHAAIKLYAADSSVVAANWREQLTHVSALFLLKRVAIPLHFQLIRDRLASEYDVATLSDRELKEFLSSSRDLVETAQGVFRAKERTMSVWTGAWIRNVAALVGDTRATHDLARLTDYFEMIGSPHPVTPMVPDTPNCWIEIHIASGDTRLFRIRDGGWELRASLGRADQGLREILLTGLTSTATVDLTSVDLKQLALAADLRRRILGKTERVASEDLLRSYTQLWANYICAPPPPRQQEQKWRGWYLVPEHGPLSIEKLRELQLILRGMAELGGGQPVLVDRSAEGVRNVVALLRQARVEYEGRHTNEKKRDLFVRQQKNYLVKLGLVDDLRTGELALTDRGRSWCALDKAATLARAYREVLEQIRWSWGSLPFYPFLRRLATEVDGRIDFWDLHNWVIHSYGENQLEELVAIIRTHRTLPTNRRARLNEALVTEIRGLLEKCANSSAYGHYRSKIRDLMVAVASAGEFRLATGGSPEDWSLSLSHH